MAKRTLEEMLNGSENEQKTSSPGGKKGRRQPFTPQEKRRLAVLWTVLIVCLAGFILCIVVLVTKNPLKDDPKPSQTLAPAYSYSYNYDYSQTAASQETVPELQTVPEQQTVPETTGGYY